MKLNSKAVHAGDRKKPGGATPVTTPIHTAASYFYETAAELDRVFAHEEEGYCYARYDNPTNSALEELVTSLEGGAGALACASGMAALQHAIVASLLDRRKSVLAASALYGATIKLLHQVLEPFGIDVNFVDICDLQAVNHHVGAEFERPHEHRRRERIVNNQRRSGSTRQFRNLIDGPDA